MSTVGPARVEKIHLSDEQGECDVSSIGPEAPRLRREYDERSASAFCGTISMMRAAGVVGMLMAVALAVAGCSSGPHAAKPEGGLTTVAPVTGRCDINQESPGPHVGEHPVTIQGVIYYRFVNEGTAPCRIEDAPVLQMIDAAGKPLLTSTYIPRGGYGPSAPRSLITLLPRRAEYLFLSDLTRAGFGSRPPKVICPASTTLQMSFPGSTGTITITGVAGRFAPYEQLGGTKVGCGAINLLPLSPIPTDWSPV